MNPADLSLPPLAAAFVFGLLGGAHCIGMCGGIMSALTFAVPPSMRQPSRLAALLLGYNLGRISSYMIAGALVALLGSVLNHALDSFALVLRILAAVMLILMALYIANWWKGLLRIEALGRVLWRRIEPIGRRLMPVVKVPLWANLFDAGLESCCSRAIACRRDDGGLWARHLACRPSDRSGSAPCLNMDT